MKRLIKILILFLILNTANIGLTNSYFSAKASIEGNRVSAGCWVAPSVPVLVYPTNPTYAKAGSAWDLNPYMDWENSVSSCPLVNTITYQYESYHDAGLTQLAYRSGWLADSRIPAPGTPDGTYYWRVRAKDQFDNTSNFSFPWLLTIDRTPPVSTFFSPVPNTNVSGNPIHISGASTDSFGVALTKLLYTNYSGACGSSYTEITTISNPLQNSPFSWSNDWTPPSSGSYCLKAEATDLAGNHESSPIVANVTYNPNPPSPEISLTVSPNWQTLSFEVTNVASFSKLSYEIIYDSENGEKGIAGNTDLGDEDIFTRKNLKLGTCSEIEGKVCVFDEGITKLHLKVTLVSGGVETILEKEINY